MSRNKKSRKPGSAASVDVVVTRNRTESDVEGRLRKRLKKRKGQKSGSRHSEGNEQKQRRSGEARDPRLGSKKKIPLIITDQKKPSKQERRLSAEQELEMLESDAQLNVLIDRIEAGENLGAGLQKYVDEKLDRIEVLMKQLGLFEPEVEEEQVDLVEPALNKVRDEQELLADFEDIDLDQFKG
jgi:ribosome assembly protein YihI (activator of Der GTPase)